MYSEIVETIKEAGKLYGKMKITESTNEKISPKTKELINRREALRGMEKLSASQGVELSELQKLVRREIKQDIRRYEEEKTKEIIENSKSIRMVKMEISTGYKIINKLRDERGELRRGERKVPDA